MESKSGLQHGSNVIGGYSVDVKPNITSVEPATAFAIKALSLQEYLGEMNIIHKRDQLKVNDSFKAKSFVEEFAKINK